MGVRKSEKQARIDKQASAWHLVPVVAGIEGVNPEDDALRMLRKDEEGEGRRRKAEEGGGRRRKAEEGGGRQRKVEEGGGRRVRAGKGDMTEVSVVLFTQHQ